MLFRENVSPRIMGSETEYTAQFIFRDDALLRKIIPERYILDDGYTESDVWLTNGGRIYQDYGDLLEYATPECRSAQEVALHEQAGERLVVEMISQLSSMKLLKGERAAAYKRSGYDLVLNRTGNILLEPMSAGHHENYATYLDPSTSAFVASALASYLATRPVWSGAGIVTTSGYAVSQKGSAIDFTSSRTVDHGSKTGFIYREDERRLEIRSGEGNMSPWQVVQKFALTSLILRLIENGKLPDKLLVTPSDASSLLHHLSRPMSADDLRIVSKHQRSFAEEGLRFAEKHPDVPREEIAAAEAVIETTRQIDEFSRNADALSLLSNRLDWAAKRAYMVSRGLKPQEISTANLVAVSYDLRWEDVALGGIARRWYKKAMHTKPDEASIRRALHQPPATRAMARTDAIKTLHDDIHAINWSSVSGRTGSTDIPLTYDLSNPAKSTLDLS